MRTLFAWVLVLPCVGLALYGCNQLRPARQPEGSEVALAAGQTAPEIVGEDFDGVPFKLSDYRGKVVVLDFWGNW